MCFSVLQCVAVCCSVLQCVAVCCSVLQCLAWTLSSPPHEWRGNSLQHLLSSLLQGSFAKETYNFIHPTYQSHPILDSRADRHRNKQPEQASLLSLFFHEQVLARGCKWKNSFCASTRTPREEGTQWIMSAGTEVRVEELCSSNSSSISISPSGRTALFHSHPLACVVYTVCSHCSSTVSAGKGV